MGLVEELEREKLHVRGNYPEDEQRLKDIDAELRKARKAGPEPDGLVHRDASDVLDEDGEVLVGRQTDGRVAQAPDPVDGRAGHSPGEDAGRNLDDEGFETDPKPKRRSKAAGEASE